MRAMVVLLLAAGAPAAAKPANAHTTQLTQAQRNLQDFDFVTGKVREDYAGWDTKVTATTRPQLDALTRELRAKVATAANDKQLLDILSQWIGFFHDRHTNVGLNATATAQPQSNDSYPSLPLDEAAVRAKLEAEGRARAPIEGIWSLSGNNYRMGLLRANDAPGHYLAVLLRTTSGTWKPGQIKAEFTVRPDGRFDTVYRFGDHSETNVVSSLAGGGAAIKIPGVAFLLREWPPISDPKSISDLVPGSDLALTKYADDTLLLRIPDFLDATAKPLRDLVEAHRSELESTPNLIIDERGNGGGSDYVFEPIVPLLYTRPIVTLGIELRASKDNIALRHAIAEKLKTDAPDQTKDLERQNARMASHLGQYVGQSERPFDIDRRDRVLPFPKHVAVLMDGAGSTGEQFLLLARQSHKVTLFGQDNSAGVLDFANVVAMPTPTGRYRLQWAISRSLRLPQDPVDPDGIAPDVRIPDSVTDPIAYAADWLRREPG